MIRRPQRSTLSPYTTLFRSHTHTHTHTHTEVHVYTHTHAHTEVRSEEHTSELQSHLNLVCRLLLEQKNKTGSNTHTHLDSALTHSRHILAPPHAQHAHLPRTPLSPSTHARNPHSNFFFFNDTATTEIYTLSLHDALPI